MLPKENLNQNVAKKKKFKYFFFHIWSFFIPKKKKGKGNIILKKFHNCAKFWQQKIMSVPNFTPKNSPFISSLPYWDAPSPISKLSGDGNAASGQWAQYVWVWADDVSLVVFPQVQKS